MTAKRSSSGFTLLEVVVVLTVISLVLGMTALHFGNRLPSVVLQSTARELAAALRHARTSARLSHEAKALVLDLDTRQYHLEAGQPQGIPRDVHVKVLDASSDAIVEGKHRFVFQPAGPTQCDSIVLWNEKRSIRIQVDPIVGTLIFKHASEE